MIVRSDQMEYVTCMLNPNFTEGVCAKVILPGDLLEGSPFKEVSWIELQPGSAVNEHTHEDQSEMKVIVGGFGVCVEEGVRNEVGAGDVILTEKGVAHSILNNGKHPLVYVAIRS
jgi:uncharacterized cupin superfamily protein